jgi:heptosyltransferase-2
VGLFFLNEQTQLQQRSRFFDFVPGKCFMWIIDGDEIYQPEEVDNVIAATNRGDAEFYDATSLTFVNDAHHYVHIDFPRLFLADKGYRFVDPNHLVKPNGQPLQQASGWPIAKFYHYSYVRNPDRMLTKIRDRVETHGEFKWQLHGEYMKRPGVKFHTTDHIPEIVKDHPLLQEKAPAEAFEYQERLKIGFIINSGMGNLILTTPMLKTLRYQFPDARISVLTWPRGSEILQGWPIVDDIITSKHDHFVSSIGGFDYLLISPTASIKYTAAMQLSKKIIIPPDKGGVWAKHESEYNLDLAKAIGCDWGSRVSNKEVDCFITQENREQANIALGAIAERPYICIAAGYLHEAHWPLKYWGTDNYAQLIKYLLEHGYNTVLLGDGDDRQEADEMLSASGYPLLSGGKATNLCGMLSIKESAAVIEGGAALISNDGGLAHVGACFQIPTVVIFTFTNIIKNIPLNKNLKLAMLPCDRRMKCQHGGWKECAQRGCLNVPVEMVIKKFEELMKEQNSE